MLCHKDNDVFVIYYTKYGVVNLYLTILDNLLEIYLVGIQSVTILSRA